jgi:hypothetical protein
VPVATSFGEKGFHCPAAGTVVVREAAGKTYTVTYAGTDPADPEGCLSRSNGKLVSYPFGLIDKSSPTAADFAAGYRKALAGPPGTVTEFRHVQFDGTNYMYRIHNEALEPFNIGAESRPTVRVSVTEFGISGNHFEGTWRLWFDVQTGAVLRRSFQLVRGNDVPNQDWTATSITVPK